MDTHINLHRRKHTVMCVAMFMERVGKDTLGHKKLQVVEHSGEGSGIWHPTPEFKSSLCHLLVALSCTSYLLLP